jgi:hypothetical protein
MKILLALVSVVALSTASTFAGDGQISSRSLANMGLQRMTALSDTDGMAIRGTSSFAFATSNASVSGGTTVSIINHPFGQHFAISVTIAFGSGAFAASGAVATAH